MIFTFLRIKNMKYYVQVNCHSFMIYYIDKMYLFFATLVLKNNIDRRHGFLKSIWWWFVCVCIGLLQTFILSFRLRFTAPVWTDFQTLSIRTYSSLEYSILNKLGYIKDFANTPLDNVHLFFHPACLLVHPQH